jgi:hypothetical protein
VFRTLRREKRLYIEGGLISKISNRGGTGVGEAPILTRKTVSRFALSLLIAAEVLVFVSLTVNVISLANPGRVPWDLYQLFDVGQENNIPAWFSAGMLLLGAYLLATIALSLRYLDRRASRMWFGLAAIFAYLSLDEAARLHERTGPVVRHTLALFGIESRDYFNYASWVVLGGLAVLVVVAIYARFFLSLPRSIRNLFILAGIVYCTGALGMELAGALWEARSPTGRLNLTYVVLQSLEEFLEMAGIIVFVYALLEYLRSYVPGGR